MLRQSDLVGSPFSMLEPYGILSAFLAGFVIGAVGVDFVDSFGDTDRCNTLAGKTRPVFTSASST